MTRQQIPKESHPTRRHNALGGTGRRSADQRQRATTRANVTAIVRHLDVSVNHLATVAVDLASLANMTKRAEWARLATDAYEICCLAHALMNDVVVAWGESEAAR